MKCCLHIFSPVFHVSAKCTRLNTYCDYSFCEKYNHDSKRCAEELFCFARAYSKFHSSELACTQADDHNSDEDDIEQGHDADEKYDDSIELRRNSTMDI